MELPSGGMLTAGDIIDDLACFVDASGLPARVAYSFVCWSVIEQLRRVGLLVRDVPPQLGERGRVEITLMPNSLGFRRWRENERIKRGACPFDNFHSEVLPDGVVEYTELHLPITSRGGRKWAEK